MIHTEPPLILASLQDAIRWETCSGGLRCASTTGYPL